VTIGRNVPLDEAGWATTNHNFRFSAIDLFLRQGLESPKRIGAAGEFRLFAQANTRDAPASNTLRHDRSPQGDRRQKRAQHKKRCQLDQDVLEPTQAGIGFDDVLHGRAPSETRDNPRRQLSNIRTSP
jgi:hypothetical protein